MRVSRMGVQMESKGIEQAVWEEKGRTGSFGSQDL